MLVHENVASRNWLLISKITREVASGLDCIHDVLGKAHCDIKPLNLVRNLKNQRFMELDLKQLTDALGIANYFTADSLYEELLKYTALKLLQSDRLSWNVPELQLPVTGSSDFDLTPHT